MFYNSKQTRNLQVAVMYIVLINIQGIKEDKIQKLK